MPCRGEVARTGTWLAGGMPGLYMPGCSHSFRAAKIGAAVLIGADVLDGLVEVEPLAEILTQTRRCGGIHPLAARALVDQGADRAVLRVERDLEEFVFQGIGLNRLAGA